LWQSWHNATLVSPNDALLYAELYPYWNRYTLDENYAKLASFTPLLMLQGELDPSTPFSQVGLQAA
jgi:hypothetical protein